MHKNHIFVWRGDYYDGHLWYVTQKDGLLVKINVGTGQIDYVLSLQLPVPEEEHTYHQVVSLGGGEFLVVPGVGNRILRVDTKDGSQVAYDFPNSDRQPNSRSKFTGHIKYNDSIYCFPGNMNYILGIDYKKMELSCQSDVIEELDRIHGKKLDIYFGWGTILKDNIVYAVGGEHNYLLEMNLDTRQYKLSRLENEAGVTGFAGIALSGKTILLTNSKRSVIQYDVQTKKKVKRIDTANKYIWLRECKEDVLLIPTYKDCYAFYNVVREDIREIPYQECTHFIDEKSIELDPKDVIETEKNIYVLSRFGNALVAVDKESSQIDFVPLRFGRSMFQYLHKTQKNVIEEKLTDFISMSLQDFIELSVLENTEK